MQEAKERLPPYIFNVDEHNNHIAALVADRSKDAWQAIAKRLKERLGIFWSFGRVVPEEIA
jgi:hypothetical protein